MFWRKKELTTEQRYRIAFEEVRDWHEFLKAETDLTEADGEKFVTEFSMKIKDARHLERALKTTMDFLESFV